MSEREERREGRREGVREGGREGGRGERRREKVFQNNMEEEEGGRKSYLPKNTSQRHYSTLHTDHASTVIHHEITQGQRTTVLHTFTHQPCQNERKTIDFTERNLRRGWKGERRDFVAE